MSLRGLAATDAHARAQRTPHFITRSALVILFACAACSADLSTAPERAWSPYDGGASSALAVGDLSVDMATDSSITLSWTEVRDEEGRPAAYELKYSTPPLSRGTGTVGCADTEAEGAVGEALSCTIVGLRAGTAYDFQVTSFAGGTREPDDVGYSNVAKGVTRASAEAPGRTGIWIDQAELMQLPTSGAAWERVLADAARDPGSAQIADQDSNHDVYTLAAALTCVRANEYCDKAREGVVSAIGTEEGARWLAVGRNLGSYVIAADLLNLRSDGNASSPGSRVERWIRSWQTKQLSDNNEAVLRRVAPFHSSANAAAQEGFVYAAVAAYLHDERALRRAWDAFRTYACDPNAPDNERIDLTRPVADGWTDAARPCAVNPKGARRTVALGLPGAGRSYDVDGALVGDMRRGGVFQWEPGYTAYPWVGLEGFVPAAVILARAGYPAFEVADRAVLRSLKYLWRVREGTGDTRWFDGTRGREVVHLINVAYGESFLVNDVAGGGRTVGYTTWTHPER